MATHIAEQLKSRDRALIIMGVAAAIIIWWLLHRRIGGPVNNTTIEEGGGITLPGLDWGPPDIPGYDFEVPGSGPFDLSIPDQSVGILNCACGCDDFVTPQAPGIKQPVIYVASPVPPSPVYVIKPPPPPAPKSSGGNFMQVWAPAGS